MTDSVQLTLRDSIATITINRPEVRNALDVASMNALDEFVASLETEEDLRAVILTGAQGTFISGGDVSDLHTEVSQEAGFAQHDLMAGVLARIATLPAPVIAAIEGAARGGGMEVALACDLRVIAENATLGFAQINMAVTPGWGGAERLYRLIGYSRALDLLLTGRVLDAQEALDLGVVNYLCPADHALHMATMLAQKIAEGPLLATRGVKAVLHAYHHQPAETARALERDTFARLWASADHQEAFSAFLEKREPRFKGE